MGRSDSCSGLFAVGPCQRAIWLLQAKGQGASWTREAFAHRRDERNFVPRSCSGIHCAADFCDLASGSPAWIMRLQNNTAVNLERRNLYGSDIMSWFKLWFKLERVDSSLLSFKIIDKFQVIAINYNLIYRRFSSNSPICLWLSR